MKKSYTLNRFYYEAKALLEKHDRVDSACRLVVHFEIEESRKPGDSRELKCSIRYEKDHDYKYLSFERTPELALDDFEKEILKSKGKNFDIESVSVDLDDDLVNEVDNS